MNEIKDESEKMGLYGNRDKIALLALVSVMALLFAGIIICDSEDVSAETTSGNVMDGTTDVGDWRITGTTLDIVSESAAASFTSLEGYEASSSASIALVTVKGFLDDVSPVLLDASIGIGASVPIQYYGDIPSYTLKSDSTNYCSNRGIGIWTYDLTSLSLTLTRSTSTSNMGLISYESAGISTIFFGYFFLDTAQSALITGYESYGGYIFHEFTALKTFRSTDHLTLGNVNLIKGVGFESITFDRLTNLSSESLRGETALREIHLPAITTIENSALRECTNLSTIEIISPNNLSIGTYAFAGCTSIVNLEITAAVSVTAGTGAFMDCSSMVTAHFNTAAFTTSGDNAFQGDSLLQEAYLGTGLVTLASYTFMNCTNLVKVNIDNLYKATAGAFKNTSIGGYVYDYVNGIFIALPEDGYITLYSVTELGSTFDKTSVNGINGAFEGCVNIKKVRFGEVNGSGGTGALTKLGNKTFSGCTYLNEVDFNTPVLSGCLGANMFASCGNLTTVTGLGSSKVDSLGNGAFLGCNKLTTLELSDHVETIADNTFSTLALLEYVDAGSGLKKIGSKAFYNCPKLATFICGDSLEEIGSQAFSLTPITSFVGGSSLKTIGNSAFNGCKELESFTVGASLKTIGNSSFEGCIKLTAFDASSSVLNTIGEKAFYKCTALASVSLGDSLTLINSYAFQDDAALVSVYAGDSLVTIGYQSFQSCSLLETFECGDKLELIRSYAFKDCTALRTFTGSFASDPHSTSNVNTVQSQAFYGCRSLETIDLGDYTRVIQNTAFQGCRSLTEFNLGTALTTIEYNAFRDCVLLQNAGHKTDWVMPDTLTIIGSNAFRETILETLTFGVGSQLDTIGSEAFREITSLKGTDTIDGLSVKVIKFPDTLQKIDSSAFYGCSSLQGIYLSSNNALYYVGGSAFYNCDLHGSLTFTNVLSTLGSSAFQNNRNLAEVLFSSNSIITTINSSCFAGCTSLANVVLPNSVTLIDSSAFSGSLCTNVTFGTGLQRIGNNAFNGSSIVSVSLPNSCTSVGTGAFYDCNYLTEVNLNNAILEKDNSDQSQAFRGCDSLVTVNLGNKIEDIPKLTFYGCPSLTTVIWSPTLININNQAFAYCYALTSVELPNTIETIGNSAFYACTSLATVNLNKVLTIGTESFRGCTSLTTLDLGSNLTAVPAHAFYGCSHLEDITFSPVLTTIGTYSFSNLYSDTYGLKNLVIPDTVTTIESYAFYNDNSLESLTVGKGVTSLGECCFGYTYASYGSKLVSLTVPIGLNLVQYSSKLIFQNVTNLQTLHYTSGGINTRITDGFDYVYGTSGIDDFARHPASASKTKLNTVIIDDDITSLGDYNLYGITALTTLTMPIDLKPVDSADSHNFENIKTLREVTFTGTHGLDYSLSSGGTDHWIGLSPWYSSTVNTLSVIFAPSVQSIGKNMFNNESAAFSKLKNVTLDGTNTIKSIGEKAFYNCSNYAGDVILNDIESLGAMCFYGTIVDTFTFGEELISVGDRALYDMALVSVTVDANNPQFTSSTDNVLYGQSSGTITSLVVYPAKKSGTSYIVPNTVQTIASYAAYGAQFTTLSIPSGVYHVGEYAFAEGKLVTLNIQCAQPDFDTGAFAGNTALATVTLPLSMETAGVFTGSNNIASYTFTGTGTSGLPADYYINNAGDLPWSSTTRSVTVVFSEGISAVDNNMFEFDSANTYITSVTLPSTLVSIGNAAFRNCNGLTSFIIPDNVSTMGTDCLAGCTRILTLTVPISLNMAIDPNHVIGITSSMLKVYFTPGSGMGYTYSTNESANDYWGNTPWAQITGFTVTMNEGIVNTGSNLFLKVGSLFLPDSLEVIGDNAFNGATMAAIDLKNVTHIGYCAFANCTKITSVTIPATLESYGGSPFKDCTKITAVTLPINIDYAEGENGSDGMFAGCTIVANYTFVPGISSDGNQYTAASSAKTPWYLNLANSKSPALTFQSGITSIGSYMFYNCNRAVNETLTYGISSVTLPSSVTSVHDSAFEGCAYMSSLTFTGQNIGAIGANAFKGCAGLTSLTVGPATTFGAGAFSGCDKIASITLPMRSDAVVNNTNPVFTTTSLSTLSFIGSGDGFDYSDTSESGSFYQLTPWFRSTKNINLTIGENIVSIGDNMFRGCQGLRGALTLPENIIELGNSTFRDCQAVTTVTASKVSRTGSSVFQDSSVTGINMPELVVVQDYAFYNCRNLSTATLSACTQIGAHAFQDSTVSKINSASGIDLAGITGIGDEAFSGCLSIDGDVSMTSSLLTIGASAFFGDVNISGLSGSLAAVTAVGASAFEGCTALAGDLSFGAVRTVGDRAFYGTAANSFTFSNQLTSLGDLALFDQSLTSIATGTNTKYVVDNTTGALYQVSGSTRILLQYPAAKVLDGDFTIAANVSEIAHYALYGADIRGILTIPSSMTLTIGEGAFSNAHFTGLNVPNTLPLANLFTGCTGISSYYFSMKNNVSGFPSDYFTVNEDSLPWHYSSVDYSVEFQSGIIALDANMFKNSTRLTSMVIPTSVGTLGEGFIYGCVGLQSLVVPANLHMDITAGNITTLKTLRLTVQGTAHSVAYDEDSGKLTPWYASTLTSLTIDSGILSIGDYFYLRTSADIVLPDTVTSVGDYAFYGSTTNSVVFSSNLQTIGDYAFYGCTMPSLALPSKVAIIGDRAFADNNSLTSVTLPDSLTGYSGQPFNGCVNISEISVPITIDYSSGIFQGCEKILRYTFTAGVNGIGYDYTTTGGPTPWYTAVSRSYNVSVTLADGVKSIGAYMFYECAKGNYGIEGAGVGSQEKFVIIPDSVTSVGAHVFDSCKNIPGFVFGSGIADIGAYAFYDCDGTNFRDVTLGESIRTVGDYAFAGCDNLSAVSLGTKLTSLGAGSFNNCTALSALSIPLSVNAVANDVHPAFENCSNLSTITFVGTGTGFSYSDTPNDNENEVGSYYQYTPWYLNQSHSITLGFDGSSTITSIGSNTFRGSTAISGTLSLPTSVNTIGSYAFQGCLNISGITLSNTLATIGDYAFEGCTSLSGDLVSTANLRAVGAHAFDGDSGITGLTGVVSGIEIIGAYAFNGCSDLGGDLALTGATSIGERAFYNTVVSSFAFGRNLSNLGDLALFDQNLSAITVDNNNSTYNVRDGVLYRGNTTVVQYPAKMTKTTGYAVPDTVTEILHYAFYGAEISGTLTIPNKSIPVIIGEQAFSRSGITALVIPVNIGAAYLFEDCNDIASYTFTGISSGLPENYYDENRGHLAWNFTDPSVSATVTFADGVTAIDRGMFYGFEQMSVLNIPTSVTALGADCLKGCNGLTSLTVPIILDMAVDAGSGITQLSTVNFIGTGAGKEYATEEVGYKVLWYYSTISNLTINSGITSIGSYSFLKVSGPAVLPDSVLSVGDYAFYGSTTGDITLSNSLQTVGAYAFYGCGLTSLVLPNTLASMGDGAFGGCTLLQSVTIPDSLTSYSGMPFNGCAALASASMPISIDYSLGMFNGCTALKNYVFTAGNGTAVDYTGKNTNVPWYSVVRGSNNINVSFANGVTVIGAHMFDGCNYAPTAIITYGIVGAGEHGEIVLNDVRSVGDYAFNGCTKIAGVQFGNEIESIGVHAFANCAGITELILAGNTTVGAGAFSNCTGISVLTIPLSADSVVSNDDPVFKGCTGLSSVTFIGSGTGAVYSDSPSSGSYYKYTPWYVSQSPSLTIEFSNCTATSIGANMFRDVSRLGGTVSVPSTVESIGDYAFYGTSVETFNLGPALSSIGYLALYDQNLAAFVLDENNNDFALYNGALYDIGRTTLIAVPAKMAVSDIVLPTTLTTVLPYAANGSAMSGILVIPASVQSIGNYAFAECTGLTGIVIESIVPGLLGTSCFLNDVGITSVTIPYTVRMAGLMSFLNNVSLYTFTGGANSGQEAAYYRINAAAMPWNFATGDVSVVFSDGIGKVDDYMFYHESADARIVSVTLPEGLTTIGISALQNCSGLRTLVLPNTLSTLGANALMGCSNVRNLTVPITFPLDIDNNGAIGMRYLEKLTFTPGNGLDPAGYEGTYTKTLWYPSNGNGYTVTFQDGIAAIGEYMYLQVSAATLADSVRSIGAYAFYRSGFTAVTINEGVQTIGDRAFAETSLASVTFPTTLTSLAGSPFDSCADLTTMTGPITIDYSEGAFSNCGNLSVFNFTSGTANQGEGFDYTADSSANTPWMDTVRRDSTPTVSFDQKIISIGDYMFANCSSNGYGISGALKLPKDLVSVGDHAFEGCNLITSITFDSKVRSIGEFAFAGCSNSSLKALVFSSALTSVGAGAFKDCSKVTNITIPIGVNAVASDAAPAFEGCTAMVNFSFIGAGDGFDYSGEFGNDSYYQLTPWYQNRSSTIAVSVGSTVGSIGDYMFAGCTGIRAAVNLGNVTEVGINAFADADRIPSVSGQKVEAVGAGAFMGCDTLGSVTMAVATSVGDDAFRDCTALKSAVLTACSSVGDRAFKDSGITTINGAVGTITLPKIGTLGDSAFEGSAAETVFLGTSGEDIAFGDHVFDNCPNIVSVTVNGDIGVLPASTFQSGSFRSPVREVVVSAAAVFLADLSGSSVETLNVSGTTSFIRDDVSASLKNCTSLTAVYLDTDTGVKVTLPEAMFDGCTSLATITLTNVLLSGPNTFRNCSALPFADLDVTTVLPANTFYGCFALTEVSAPLVTAIGDSAFEASRLATFNGAVSGNASLAGIVTVGDRAFYGTSLQSLSDTVAVDRVGASAFYGCASLSGEVDLPAVTIVGDRAFYGTSVSRFEFGSVLRSVGDLALFDQNLAFIVVDPQNSDYVSVDGILYNKDRTELIVVPAKLERSDIEFPSGLSVIAHFAAYGAMIDGKLVIPAGVREIGESAFENCAELTSLVLECKSSGSDRELIGDRAFDGMTGLTSLTVPTSVKLGGVFDYDNIIQEYVFTGDLKSGLPSKYYENNAATMPWAFATKPVTVTISSGIGEIDRYMFSFAAPNTNITSVNIAEGVYLIGEYAFKNCAGLSALTLPESVSTIYPSSLYGCSGIKSLTVPITLPMNLDDGNIGITNLAYLTFTQGKDGEGADYNQTSATQTLWYGSSGYILTLGPGIKTMGDFMYLKPSNIVQLPESLLEIGESVFEGAQMSTITFNENLTTLGNRAFAETQITSIALPDSLVHINGNVFEDCTSLKTVSMPITILYGGDVFKGCTIQNFTFNKGSDGVGRDYTAESVKATPWYATCAASVNVSIAFGAGVVSIGDYMFYGCSVTSGSSVAGIAGTVTMPSTLTSIGEYAFYGCNRIANVVFNENLQSIGDAAFRNCTGLTAIILGNSIRNLGASTFAGCFNVSRLSIPLSFNTVASDENPAFYGCTGIRFITFTGTSAGTDYSLTDRSGNNNYYRLTPWYFSRSNQIEIDFAESIPSIGDYTFYECRGITGSVVLHDQTSSIGVYAFRGCTGIRELTLENLDVRLGNGCFADCTNLGTLTMPISVNAVSYVLDNSSNPATLPAFQNTVKVARLNFTGFSGFDYSTEGTSNCVLTPWNANRTVNMTVTFADTVTSIGTYTFYNCNMLKGDVVFPGQLISVGDYAFSSDVNLGTVSGTSVQSLGERVFEGCTTLTAADLPSVSALPAYTFYGCTRLASATLDSCTSVGDYCFANTAIRTIGSTENQVTLTGLTRIGEYAFANSGVINVYLEAGIAGLIVEDRAFLECRYLETFEIEGTVSVLQYNTFRSAETSGSFVSPLRSLKLKGVTSFIANLADNFPYLAYVDISKATSFGQAATYQGLFQNCTGLSEVVLFATSGNTRLNLPAYMFSGCTNLSVIDMSNVALRYGHEFEGCVRLSEANLANTTSISDYAFSGCTSLVNVSAPNATDIGVCSFENTGLETVTDSTMGTINGVGVNAFRGCKSLTSVTMSALRNAEMGAFEECTNLETASFSSLEQIPSRMFYNDTALKSVTLGEAKGLGVTAFYNCSALEEVSFPKLTSIGIVNEGASLDDYENYAVFYNCNALTYVNMPLLRTVGTMAFYKCGALVSFNVERGATLAETEKVIRLTDVSTIGKAAFAETGAQDVLVGKSQGGINTMGDYAFYKCGSLINFASPSLYVLPEHLFNNSDAESTLTDAPMLGTVSVPMATTIYSSFHDCTRLTEVNMPSATTFSTALFLRCTGLQTVHLMEEPARGNIVELSTDMFNGCSRLATINLTNVQMLGSTTDPTQGNTFRGCSALVSVELPVSTQIPCGAFTNCVFLESVSAAAVQGVGSQAFVGCTRLASVDMPVATALGDAAFRGCSALGHFNADTGYNPFIRVLSIGDYAFSGCAFTKVVLGPNTGSVGAYAFQNNNALSTVIIGDAQTEIKSGTFQYCPLSEVHISSSVTKIGEGAFDWSTTSVDMVHVYFNGDLSAVYANASFVGNGRVAMTAHGDSASESYFRNTWVVNISVNYVAERCATVILQFDGTSLSPTSTRAIYGGRIVLPYFASGSNVRYYSFAMQSGGAFGIFASEADYSAGHYAESGDAVPVYPLLNTRDTLTFTGYLDTAAFIRDITVQSKSFNDTEMVPESQTVHYGSLFTIPSFVSPLVNITDIQMERADGTRYSLDIETESVLIGYNFVSVWLYSTDQKITVYFVSGETERSTEVVIQSFFEIPEDLKFMEEPAPGYEFVGWWTNPGQGGERAVPGETKFLGGQTWYARFSPLKFTVSIISDNPTFSKSLEMTGPYKLFTVGADLYYTDLDHVNNTLFMNQNEVTGYTVSLYFDSTSLSQITDTSEELVGVRTVEISVSMNYYEITLNFSYMGTVLTDEFLIEDWDIGSETIYTTGMKVERIAYTEIRDGLLMPIPLHDVYTLSYIHANGERLVHTDDGYILYPSNFNGALSIDLYFMMARDLYSVQFVINDDARTVVNNGTTYEPNKYVTLVTVRTYTCIGYEFAGYSFENEAYDPTHTYMPALNRIMLTSDIIDEYSKMCTITFYGVWKPITYTVNFDLAGYTTDEQPEPVTVYVGETFALPSDIYRVGQQITSWHWILGETSSTENYTDSLTLEKYMVESYANENSITLQCAWGAKTYTVQVDPASGTKQFIPVNNVAYGSTFHIWDIGTYTRAFMMFGGWSVGEDGTKYASNVDVPLSDEMAAYGDQHDGVVTFFFVWINNEYRVQYKLEGGEGDAPVDNNVYIVNDIDTPFTLAPESSMFYRDGYNFVGWKYSVSTSILYTNTSGLFDSILAQNADSNGIVTFYAVWSQKEYHLSYNLKGGISGPYAPLNVMYGEDVIISAPTQAGYDFVGWKASTTATADGNLTKGAQYLSSGTYRLWDGQRAVNVTTFRDLCSVNDATVVFEAIWDNATYSVSYDRNGGTGTIVGEMTTIKVGQIIQLPTLSNANKTGYTFMGWSIDKVNLIPANTEFTTEMVEGGVNTVVFYAVWDANPYNVQYKYTEEQTYATMETAFTVEFNIPTYERVGYSFGGWAIDGADSNAYWSSDGVFWYKLGGSVVKGTYFKNLTAQKDATVTINAVWTPIQYRIAYNANGGTGVVPVDTNLYVIGDEVILKDYSGLNGTYGNKVCIGWSLDPNGGVTSNSQFTEGLAGKADATNTVTLYASWIDGLCVISIDLSGITVSSVPTGWTYAGDGIYTSSVEYKSSMKDALSAWDNVTLSKDGYTFTGFSYGSDSVTSNISVEPTFEKIDMNIAYVFGAVVVSAIGGIIALTRFRH